MNKIKAEELSAFKAIYARRQFKSESQVSRTSDRIGGEYTKVVSFRQIISIKIFYLKETTNTAIASIKCWIQA